MKKTVAAALIALSAASVATAQIKVVGVGSGPVRNSQKEIPEVEMSRLDDKSRFDNFGLSEYVALYDYNQNTRTKEGTPVNDIYVTALRIGPSGALFSDYLTYKSDSISAAGGPAELYSQNAHEAQRAEHFFEPVITQNIPEGRMVVNDQAGITLATYEEPFANIDWTLTGEESTFAGYPVSEAVGEYGGRTWKAWFTEEIPAAYGPWKLAGLPGLILRAADSEGLHEFKLIQFVKAGVPLTVAKDAARVKTDREKFIEMKNRSAGDPFASINPASVTEMTVIRTKGGGDALLINGVRIKMTENKLIPLELK